MRILLVSAQNMKYVTPVIPIGLFYIKASIEEEGHDAEILDLAFCYDIEKTLDQKINKYKPDLVGVSIRNIEETKSLEGLYDFYRNISRCIRKKSRMFLGGAGFSLFPMELINMLDADFGIVGDGELAIKLVINNFLCNPCELKSLYHSERFTNINVDYCIKARREHWELYGQYYSLIGGIIPLETSRGCSYSCSYCTYPKISGYKINYRPIQAIEKEIECISKFNGVKEIILVDSVFNTDEDRMRQIANVFKNNKIRWKCSINPKNVSQSIIKNLKDSGCYECEIGIDSVSNDVLKDLGKDFRLSDVDNTFQICELEDMKYSISLILGSRYETNESLMMLKEFLSKWRPSSIHAFVGIRLYPGTKKVDQVYGSSSMNLLEPSAETFQLNKKVVAGIKNLVSEYEKVLWKFSNLELLQ